LGLPWLYPSSHSIRTCPNFNNCTKSPTLSLISKVGLAYTNSEQILRLNYRCKNVPENNFLKTLKNVKTWQK